MKRQFVLFVLALGALVAPAWGQISYVGSSTIGEHVIPDAARAFTAKTGIPFGSVSVQGSGKGLEMVLKGQAALAGVSRGLTAAEKRGRIYHQIIGYDVVSVFVHPRNPVAALSREQLKAIYTGRVTDWKTVGGRAEPIVLMTLVWGAGRAQMVEFQDHVLDGASYHHDRREFDKQSDLAAGLLAEPQGIAAISASFARPGLKALAIDGFAPEPAHVRSGAYLLSRPLIVVTQSPPRPEVRRFVEFLLSLEGQRIVARQFVPAR